MGIDGVWFDASESELGSVAQELVGGRDRNRRESTTDSSNEARDHGRERDDRQEIENKPMGEERS